MKSIRAYELSEWLCMMEIAVRGEIAVTGDMVPTIVFGFSTIDRSEGLPICTKAELVLLIHHLVTVLATICLPDFILRHAVECMSRCGSKLDQH